MSYTSTTSHSARLTPASAISISVKLGDRPVADTYETWTRFLLASTPETTHQTPTMPQRLDLSKSPTIQSMDWNSSWGYLVKALLTSKVFSKAQVSIGDYQVPSLTVDERFLPRIDDALRFLNTKIESSVEDIFFNFEGTHGRAPGFVVNLRIVISEYGRELEHEIYRALADMIRKNPELLFDAHVIASKRRKPEDFMSPLYNRYRAWSG